MINYHNFMINYDNPWSIIISSWSIFITHDQLSYLHDQLWKLMISFHNFMINYDTSWSIIILRISKNLKSAVFILKKNTNHDSWIMNHESWIFNFRVLFLERISAGAHSAASLLVSTRVHNKLRAWNNWNGCQIAHADFLQKLGTKVQ